MRSPTSAARDGVPPQQRYWTLAEYLGFGPGAHSDFGGERFALARDLDAYLAGHTVYSERSAPSARERETERVMLVLRTTRGVAADTLPEAARRILRNCEAHGLAIFPAAFTPSRPAAFWSPTPSLSIFWKQWSFDGTFFRLSSSLLLRAVMV